LNVQANSSGFIAAFKGQKSINIIILTMYKYTYLLSDSYRQEKSISMSYQPYQQIQQQSTSRIHGAPRTAIERAQSSAGRFYELKNQYQQF
jgi:hypothetical protein